MMGRLLKRKIAVLLALAFGQMCGTALAQTSPPPAAKAASRLTLRVALADAGSSLREVVVQTGEKEFQSIAVNPYRISKAVVLKAMPAQLNVFAKNAETTGAPLASVPMPATVRRALVVLSPGPTKESPAPQAIVLDEAQFPAQSIWFQNSTANPVAPDGRRMADDCRGRHASVPTGFLQRKGPQRANGLLRENAWRTFSSTRWVLPLGQRHLVFFGINPRTQRMDYNSLTDYLPN